MNVFNFYNEGGWNESKNVTKDAFLFEDLRNVAKEYISYSRNKVNFHIPKKGIHLLDFASGPIQYKEYLNYSKNFKFRHCVDFSREAIKIAKKKIGKKGKYYCDDFLKINFKENFFDCIVSLHTIYHINKNQQAKVINKLIKISKKNSPIIIIYSNPNSLIAKIKKIFFFIKKKQNKHLYFYCHNLNWWKQFAPKVSIEIKPWRSFSSQHQKIIFPDNIFGKFLLKLLIYLENNFPNFFSNNFQYPMIILRKR